MRVCMKYTTLILCQQNFTGTLRTLPYMKLRYFTNQLHVFLSHPNNVSTPLDSLNVFITI